MRQTYAFPLRVTLYNRTYAPDTVQQKVLTVTLGREVEDDSSPLSELEAASKDLIYYFDKAQIINVEDPYLIRLLEPKSGNTVHNFLDKLKNAMTGTEVQTLGLSNPSDTVNGYKVAVVGAAQKVTMERMAERFREMADVDEVTLLDGSYTILVSR